MIYLCDKSQILTMTIVFEFEYLFPHIEPIQEKGKYYFNIFHKPLSYSKLRAKVKHQGGIKTFDVRQVPKELITLNKCDILIKHMEDFALFQDDE